MMYVQGVKVSRDTAPCRMTSMILHGFVSPEGRGWDFVNVSWLLLCPDGSGEGASWIRPDESSVAYAKDFSERCEDV